MGVGAARSCWVSSHAFKAQRCHHKSRRAPARTRTMRAGAAASTESPFHRMMEGLVSRLAAHLPVYAAGFGTVPGLQILHTDEVAEASAGRSSASLDKRYAVRLLTVRSYMT